LSGSNTFTCPNPMNPGASPAKITSAATPPTVAVTFASLCENVSNGAADPVDTGGFTVPNPVTYATTAPGWRTAAKIPGADAAIVNPAVTPPIRTVAGPGAAS
jgi:hypothetical protein